ncbi:MAG: RHS repeat protein [Dysgonamonadaceae bacterium]|jgi:YD repeat-containing protein|nr:RHS repeat protein [Dysgonamonadaceae bacterium]
MKRVIIFIFLSFSIFREGISQTVTQPLVFQSPEISSLVKEVTTPVSLSSGTVNVEIPLYTLNHGDITVPISMSYDASGVKVDAQPGWVGQNWSLKAGGMISRIVKGIPDETYVEEETFLMIDGDNHYTKYYPVGFLYNGNKLKNTNWNTTTQIESWAKNEKCELEADEFIFNFCGHTGKFYANEDGNIVCTDKRYKINAIIYLNIPMYDGRVAMNVNKPESFTYYKNNMMVDLNGRYIGGFVRWRVSKIMGFCITAPDGIKYYFGMYNKAEDDALDIYSDMFRETEITADFFSQFFEENFSSWYLERIVSPLGNTVEFKYEIGAPTVSYASIYSVSSMSGSAPSGLGWFFGGNVSASNFYAGQNLSGKLIRPVFLTEIKTPNELIKFSRSNSNTLRYNYGFIQTHLESTADNYDPNIFIPVYEGQLPIAYYVKIGVYIYKIIDYTLLKTAKLDEISVKSLNSNEIVKKYQLNYNESSDKRLQLLSVNEKADEQSSLFTTFSYNSTQLPGFLDIRNDHWGYYNDKMAKVDYQSATSMTNYYNLREPDSKYTKAGILENITYPTGGTKKLIYEANRYNRVIKRDTNSGALSLQYCTEKNGGGLRVKEIIETNGLTEYSKKYTYSQGILNGEIQYYWSNYQGKLLNGNTYNASRFLTTSLLPVSNNSDGGSVSYSNVAEYNSGNGHIEYIFSNHDNTLDENSVSIDLQKSPYSPLSSKVMERGKLLETRTYKNGNPSPIKKETYQYAVLNNNLEYIKSVYLRRLVLFGDDKINAVEGSAYKTYIYPYNVESKTEYFTYSDSQTLQNKYTWTYDSYNQVTSYTNSNNSNNHKELFKYPTDYTDAIYLSMAAKNIFSPVVEKITTVKNGVETERVKTNYKTYGELILPSSIQYSFSGANNYITSTTFDSYSSKGNLVESTDKNGIKTTYLWGYNHQYPIAEIKNATYSQVKNILGQTLIDRVAGANLPASADMTAINNLRSNTNLPNAQVTTYTYRPLVGMTSKTDPDGVKTTYEYDAFGRLQYVKDENDNVIENYKYNYKQ